MLPFFQGRYLDIKCSRQVVVTLFNVYLFNLQYLQFKEDEKTGCYPLLSLCDIVRLNFCEGVYDLWQLRDIPPQDGQLGGSV
jgi:hypothetical protein